MNIQNLLSSLSQSNNPNQPSHNQVNNSSGNTQGNVLDSLSSFFPGGLAGGAAAGGVMALLMSSKSARKMAAGVAKVGGTAVLGGLAYKAYDNWQKNKAMGQTQAVTEQEISQITLNTPAEPETASTPLHMTLIMAMIAASKADGHIDALEQKHLFDAIGKLDLSSDEKAAIFDLMTQEISIQDIVNAIEHEEHKPEVYLSAYLAIEVDEQSERAFLNDLAIALELPKGFPAYLEQQADQGVAA